MNESNRFQLKRDYIVEQLRAAIAQGELRPGQKLRQEELAARFQISSTPVREALRKLEAEGLVTSVPHQGVYVTRLSAQQVEEHYRLRVLLEVHAIGEAMQQLQNAGSEQRAKLLTDLEKYQVSLKTAFQEGRKAEIVPINYALHLRLYDEARSPLLKQMIVDLWKRLPFSSLWLVPGRAEQAQDEHEDLFEAIRQQDSVTAEQILRQHIELSGRVFLEHFRANFPSAAVAEAEEAFEEIA